MLAHKKAMSEAVRRGYKTKVVDRIGIFKVFKADRIEYVMRGNESEKRKAKLIEQGLELVEVKRDIDLQTTID